MSLIADAFEDLLRDHCTPAWVRQVEAGQSSQALWDRIADAGFLDLLVPESWGGAGQPLAELHPLLLACGRHAVPLPVGQTVAARTLLGPGLLRTGAQGGLLEGPLTLAAHLHRGAAGTLRCALVPFGQVCSQVLACDSQGWLLLDAARAQRISTGVTGSLTASFEWGGDGVLAQGPESLQVAVESWAAAIHAGLIAGALGRVFEMTLAHCNVREQFGRPLGRFQAVQHQLAVMAEQVAAASIAAEAAFQVIHAATRTQADEVQDQPQGEGAAAAPGPGTWPAALAKARASEAAAEVAAIAHALHGAIGITAEYDLQLYTRRLHEWRTAHGSEDHWHRRLGLAVLAQPGPLSGFVQGA
jgi:alkylation response protein AidB-like acyl-CoA dehydrogenase